MRLALIDRVCSCLLTPKENKPQRNKQKDFVGEKNGLQSPENESDFFSRGKYNLMKRVPFKNVSYLGRKDESWEAKANSTAE